mgnify:CR=1 FL=1
MKWSSAISSAPVIEDAISECVLSVKTDIGDDEINFACLFVSPHYSGCLLYTSDAADE